MSNRNHASDAFAEITQAFSERWSKGLVEPQPPDLPAGRVLPARNNPSAAFKPRKRMRTASDLAKELDRFRARYAPFMRDFALLEKTRESVVLDKFDWRLETDSDRRDFAGHTLAGAGNWETVSIPHYGPPIGRATAYYRTTFELTRAMLDKGALFLRFKGVDYKAQVFVNGTCVGFHEGFFAPFEFDLTAIGREGTNALLVKVENDAIMGGNGAWQQLETEGDKIYAATGPGWDDPVLGWHHCPPGMGIYQDVIVEARPTAFVHDVFVRPLSKEGRAEAWVEVWNTRPERRRLFLRYSIHGQNFGGTPGEKVVFVPEIKHVPGFGDMPKPGDHGKRDLACGPGVNYFRIPFQIPDPRLWSPEEPWLYQIQIELLEADASPPSTNPSILDRKARQFGMRFFRMDEKGEPKGRFFLNDREVRLRGANTMGSYQQCVMRRDWDQLRDDVLLAKICNMNYIRFTQRPVHEEIYEHCDRLGIMTQCDLPLFGVLRRNQFVEALRQCREMEELVRSHPCNVMVSYINEPFPNGGSKPHRHLDHEELRAFFSAADIVIHQANPDRVIKSVDGDYDPPSPGLPDRHCYNGWYGNHGMDMGKLHKGYWQRVKKGWNYGCGEFGAEGLDPVPLMRKRYPAAWLPQSPEEESGWTPRAIVSCQTGNFHHMWFETQRSLEDWVRASQEHQAWATRTMAEAFRRDSRMVSFCIHLFIDAFPAAWMKVIMDVERNPKPAFFAYRDALEPLQVHWRSDRYAFFSGEELPMEAWVCNDRDETIRNAQLHYQLELGGKVLHSGKTKASVPSCGSAFQGFLPLRAPVVERRTQVLLRIGLLDKAGKILSDNATTLTLFPPLPVSEAKPVYILGSAKGEGARLARRLKIPARYKGTIRPGETILVDDFPAFEARREEVLGSVEAGATVVFNQLPPGDYDLAGARVCVEPCGMGERHFVNRDTGHPLVAGFQPNDFKFLHDSEAGYVTPFLRTVFTGPGFRPILTSGNGVGSGGWASRLAAAEMPLGKGVLRVNQFQLSNRLGNPVMRIYAERLLRARG